MAQHKLGLTRGDLVVVIVGFPLAGLVAGWGLPVVADWLLGLPWVPFAGPLRLVAELGSGWGRVALVVAGGLLGAGVAFLTVHETLNVVVDDNELRFRLGDRTWAAGRGDVSAVFVDGKLLVVLDRESRQVVRERLEHAGQAGAVFREHGYPWADQDPYAELYRRWLPDLPDLPAAVNAVLTARAVALRGKSATDAAELRDEVQKLGYTVRDEGTNQHWRPLVRS